MGWQQQTNDGWQDVERDPSLYDVPPRRQNRNGSKAYWSTYQSGLFTAGGTAKPAYTAYVLDHQSLKRRGRPDELAAVVAVLFLHTGTAVAAPCPGVAPMHTRGDVATLTEHLRMVDHDPQPIGPDRLASQQFDLGKCSRKAGLDVGVELV